MDESDRVASGFHPPLRHIPAAELGSGTAQTPGMTRREAISSSSVGSRGIWMGQTHVHPATASANHHHGASETGIYVVSGHPEFVFASPETGGEVRISAAAGDYVFVPPFTPHREENNDPSTEAVVVIARSTQEAIVVNLPSLHAVVDAAGAERPPVE